jgi:hypothetical protein
MTQRSEVIMKLGPSGHAASLPLDHDGPVRCVDNLRARKEAS